MNIRTPHMSLKRFPALALGLWLLLRPLPGLSQESVVEMSFRNQHLSARLHDAPLSEVIDRIEKAGIWVKGKNHVGGQKVSLNFQNVPVRLAFRRILAGLNFCLVYNAKDRLEGLVLVGVGKARVRPPPRPTPPVKRLPPKTPAARTKKAK